jgi:alkanesulfonate monooxygenase SsuD/methylene tetrahydromethanopterin reductase-like flavin-dependent oxidoreductase (luciferase family)
MPSHIQFGWALPSGPRTSVSRKAFLASVEQGFELVKGHFDSAWIIDHLQYEAQPLLEAWTALTYFAALHREFDFGNVVLCQSFRNPALLAKMAATFQYTSGGRFILGKSCL